VVWTTIKRGALRSHQRRLDRAFGTANLSFLRAAHSRHHLVRAAIKSAHKVAKVDAKAVATERRIRSALRAPLARDAKPPRSVRDHRFE
jgi:hypothetical protein